jgi:hypothetical protein
MTKVPPAGRARPEGLKMRDKILGAWALAAMLFGAVALASALPPRAAKLPPGVQIPGLAAPVAASLDCAAEPADISDPAC